MTKWKFKDYLAHYHEREGIIENDKDIKNLNDMKVKNLAWNDTKKFFVENESENIADEAVLIRVAGFLREFIDK